MTDDCTWLIPGKPERSRTAGLYTKERIARLFQRMLEGLVHGLTMRVTGMLAEGDRVAVDGYTARARRVARCVKPLASPA